MSKFVVKISTSVRAGLRHHIAVMEVEDWLVGAPTMISVRAKGVIRIVHRWDDIHMAKGEDTVWGRTMKEANEMCFRLNNGQEKRIRKKRLAKTPVRSAG